MGYINFILATVAKTSPLVDQTKQPFLLFTALANSLFYLA
jgi:hypothetical protein